MQCDDSGCNRQSATVPAALSCIQCSGTEECQWGLVPTKATACTAEVGFTATESCYSLTTPGGIVSRGCTLEADTQCANGNCLQCSEAGCNGQNEVTQSCLSCKSDVAGQANCVEENQTVFTSQCQTVSNIIEYADRGCFTRNDGKNIKVHILGVDKQLNISSRPCRRSNYPRLCCRIEQ